MAILLENHFGWIISHSKFFENINVQSIDTDKSLKTFKLNPELFNIIDPFKEAISCSKNRKVKELELHQLSEPAKLVKDLYESIMNLPDAKAIFIEKRDECSETQTESSWPRTNVKAVKVAEDFFDSVKDIKFPDFYGTNPYPNHAVISGVTGISDEHQFLFPPMSNFHCKDVSNMKEIFEKSEEKFDLIIMDPPWWNKFIRRKKRNQSEAGYQMIGNDGLKTIPVKNILTEDGIVVVWCTNAKSHHDAVMEFFKAWDVHLHLKLFWLKVTTSGLPVSPFNEENKKQPFETIFIGGKAEANGPTDKDSRLIMSVPSSINSHKPPLTEVLRSLYPTRKFDKKLEIFARYLLPGFTSFGNEVIKLQHLSLYVER